ncbi:hypothetical protein ACF8D4_22625 [Shewanella sp. YQ_9]
MATMNNRFIRLFGEVDFKKLGGNIILVLSSLSSTFVAYIYFFDINILSLVDAKSFAGHVTVAALYYVLSSALVNIFIHYLLSVMSGDVRQPLYHIDTDNKAVQMIFSSLNKIIFALENANVILYRILSHLITKIFLITCVFSGFYVGLENLLKIIAILFWYTIVFVVFYLLHTIVNKRVFRKVEDNSFNVSSGLSVSIFNEMKNHVLSVFVGKIGVFVILISVSVGYYRGEHITNTSEVTLRDSSKHSIILNTESGVVLISADKEKLISFVSWNDFSKSHFSQLKRNNINQKISAIDARAN